MSDEKRKRSPYWLPSEKSLLLDLVEMHYNVIENKKTDGISMKTKLAEWQIISVEYNSQTTHCHREAENLKSQWENMKKAAKKDAANARMHRIKTGGGPPDKKKEDPMYSRIIALIKASAVGLYNPYDDDSMAPIQVDSKIFTPIGLESEGLPGSCSKDLKRTTIIEIDPPQPLHMDSPSTSVEIQFQDNHSEDAPAMSQLHVYDAEETEQLINKDWGDYTPQLLKTPVSAQLKISKVNKVGVSRRRPEHTKSSLESLHHRKIEAINFQKALAIQESEANKTISEIEIEIKKEKLKQEKIKTRLLLLELREMRKKYKKNIKPKQ